MYVICRFNNINTIKSKNPKIVIENLKIQMSLVPKSEIVIL